MCHSVFHFSTFFPSLCLLVLAYKAVDKSLALLIYSFFNDTEYLQRVLCIKVGGGTQKGRVSPLELMAGITNIDHLLFAKFCI